MLEAGDYPILDDEDLAAVMLQIRRWADFAAAHPSTTAGKDEEEMRDSLLHSLNSKWPGTAETFSKLGRTDICVVLDTASATGVSDVIFKAECKVYGHAGDVSAAFKQLTKRYLTLRETRGALILFVRDPRLHPKVRQRAIDRLVQRHGARLMSDDVAGWPVLDVPHPDESARTVRLVVAVIDVSSPLGPRD